MDNPNDALWRVEKARFPLPVVIVYHGSVWNRMVWGLTRGHAVRRGRRFISAEARRG